MITCRDARRASPARHRNTIVKDARRASLHNLSSQRFQKLHLNNA